MHAGPPIPLPRPLREAVAGGWRGLTVVRAHDEPFWPMLVRVADGPALGADAAVWIGAANDGTTQVPARIVARIGSSRRGPGDGRLLLDLRLAAVRRLVSDMARAGAVPLVEVSRADDEAVPAGCICLHPARDLMRAAAAMAGEWHADDPGRGLPSSICRHLERDARVPRVVPGARIGDPPALVVPAGSPGCGPPPPPAGHDRLTVAEVALGPRACVTALYDLVGLRPPRAQ